MSELTAAKDVMPATQRATAGSARSGAGPVHILHSIRSFAAQPAVAKSLPAIGLVAVLGLAALMWMLFSSAPERNLFSGLVDEDKAAVAEALTGAGIAYEIDRGTGALTVSEDDYHQAKMLLAAQGLPKSAPDGDAMIGSLPLGASRAVEGERLRAARELDLARTIEEIDAVQNARVHLAVETPSVFIRDRSERAASVLLRLLPGRVLGESQVQAIVHLVAASVPGLAPDGVSIVDQNGRLLSSGGDKLAEASERQLSVQTKIEDRYRETLTALLTPIVGAGNFTAEVHADVDFSETQATRESFPKDASTVRSEEVGRTTENGQATAGGIPGALSNQPPPAAQVAAAPGGTLTPQPASGLSGTGNGKFAENVTRSYAIGREVSVTHQPTGQVQRLSVAVALKAPETGARSKQQLAEIEALVKGAIGFNPARGDFVALRTQSFAPVEDSQPSWWEAGWVSTLGRNITALGIAALLIFGLAKPLMRSGTVAGLLQARPQNGQAALGKEIAAAISGNASRESDITLSAIEAAPSYEARAVLIRDFVRQDPARAALVVRDLLRSDKGEGAEKNG